MNPQRFRSNVCTSLCTEPLNHMQKWKKNPNKPIPKTITIQTSPNQNNTKTNHPNQYFYSTARLVLLAPYWIPQISKLNWSSLEEIFCNSHFSRWVLSTQVLGVDGTEWAAKLSSDKSTTDAYSRVKFIGISESFALAVKVNQSRLWANLLWILVLLILGGWLFLWSKEKGVGKKNNGNNTKKNH